MIQELSEKGWHLTSEGVEALAEGLGKATVSAIIRKALDYDLREIGATFISEDFYKSKTEFISGPCVLQIQKIKNAAAPKYDTYNTGPVLLRLYVSDGITTVSCIQCGHYKSVNMDTPPGTKIFLKNTKIPFQNGFLLLSEHHFTVLGGNVSTLVKKWELSKHLASHVRRSDGTDDPPPPWTPFGKTIATSNVSKGNFKSLEQENKEEKEDEVFTQQRQANIAEVSKAKEGKRRVFGGGKDKPATGYTSEKQCKDNLTQEANNRVQVPVESLPFNSQTPQHQKSDYQSRNSEKNYTQQPGHYSNNNRDERYQKQYGRYKTEDNRKKYGANESRNYNTNESKPYTPNTSKNYNPHESRNYKSNESRNYPAHESRNYSTNESRNYSANESRNYSGNESRNYSGNESRNYSANEPRQNSTNESRNYSTNERRHYSTHESQNYTSNPPRNCTGNESRNYSTNESRNYSTNESKSYQQDNNGMSRRNDCEVTQTKSSDRPNQKTTNKNRNFSFKKGQEVLARYWEDKQFYYAIIHEVGQNRTCVVHFVEYGNHEEVSIADILPCPDKDNSQSTSHHPQEHFEDRQFTNNLEFTRRNNKPISQRSSNDDYNQERSQRSDYRSSTKIYQAPKQRPNRDYY